MPKSRVLLIEDSTFLRLSNERILTRAGYEVSAASDGEEGLRIAQETIPDLILLDMLLPKVSGPDVLRKLKESPATISIPVIVLTSLPQCNEEKLLQDGAAAYFEKSVLGLDKNPDRIVAVVGAALRKVHPHEKTAASGS